jgi:hypothetical protein
MLKNQEAGMGKTTAERQAGFKAKLYAKGYKQKQTWMDEDGFTVRPGNIEDPRPRVAHADFLEELKNLVGPMSGKGQEEIYAELLVYARSFRKRWDARRKPKKNA